MNNLTRMSALDLIRSNIDKHGHHVYLISGGGPLPRFAYTIGLRAQFGTELILAGALIFSAEEVNRIINGIAASLEGAMDLSKTTTLFDSLGSFSLREVDSSWSRELMIGALDFYGKDSIEALQVVPDQDHWTLDIPDMEKPWSPAAEPVWQWLSAPWSFQVSSKSVATTNLAALRGERITEAARWEEDQWELFSGAGPDVPKNEILVVSLGTLLALDPTLVAVTQLDVGRALWRDSDNGDWQKWGDERETG